MGRPRGWTTTVTGRAAMRSPGRPSVARREHRQGFWAAVARGVTSEDAGVEAGVSPAVGSRWFRECGGMPPSTFEPHTGRYLSFAEREEIAICHAHGFGVRRIAGHLGRSPSTVSRELRRNAGTRGGTVVYRAGIAQWHRDRRAARPKTAKLVAHPQLQAYVQERLAGLIATPDGRPVPGPQTRWIGRRHGRRQDRCWTSAWSPEQIAGRIRVDFPHDESMRISHEAIYQALYIKGRGGLHREYVACLRTGRALRKPRARTRRGRSDFITPAGHGATAVREAITAAITALPAELRRSLSWDRGKELSQHIQLRADTGTAIYFADAYSPWQRGTNENTNGLLRQYFPKGTDLSRHSIDDLAAVATALNNRPRKALGWKTPAEALQEHLGSLDQGAVATTP